MPPLTDGRCRYGLGTISGCRCGATQGSAAFSAEFFTRLVRGPTLWTDNVQGCAAVSTELAAFAIIAVAPRTAHTSPLGAMTSPTRVEAFIKPTSLKTDRSSPCVSDRRHH